jgi:hypothetical protein
MKERPLPYLHYLRDRNMSSLESSTLTFVVTIWIESSKGSDPIGKTTWRGEIRNVMEGESKRVAFDSLDELSVQIRPYLKAQGVQ